MSDISEAAKRGPGRPRGSKTKSGYKTSSLSLSGAHWRLLALIGERDGIKNRTALTQKLIEEAAQARGLSIEQVLEEPEGS